LPQKKANTSRKKRPEKRSVTEQFLQVADHVFSYFEILILYIRKSLQEKVKTSLYTALVLINLSLLNLAGVLFVLNGVYHLFLEYFQQNATSASFAVGGGLILLTGIPILVLIRRIAI